MADRRVGLGGAYLGFRGSSMSAAKLSFYSYLLRQLQDDETIDDETIEKVGRTVRVVPDSSAERDFLFNVWQRHIKESGKSKEEWQTLNARIMPPLAPGEDFLDLTKADEGDESDESDDEAEGKEDEGNVMPGAVNDIAAQIREAKRNRKRKRNEGIDPATSRFTDEDFLVNDLRRAVLRQISIPEPTLLWSNSSKGAIRCVAYSKDGRLCACGSGDTSIKVVELSKMRAQGNMLQDKQNPFKNTSSDAMDIKPIIRTYYDHIGTVSCIVFHPRLPQIFSGSFDKTIKIFDLTRPASTKRASHIINEESPVNTMAIHPSGDFLLVGTQHKVIRLYDLSGGASHPTCYTTQNPDHHHSGPINALQFSSDGSLYASGSADGHIGVWDAVTNRRVNLLRNAHSGQEVKGLKFSRTNRYLLSWGSDNRAKLWDMLSGDLLQIYGSPGGSGRTPDNYCEFMAATFVANEKWVVLSSDKDAGKVYFYDAKTGRSADGLDPALLNHPTTGHFDNIRCIEQHPFAPAYCTGAEDHRIRFFDITQKGGLDAPTAVLGVMDNSDY